MDSSYTHQTRFDTYEFERQTRLIKHELLTKRSQVEQLRKELDSSNMKMHEMARTLEKTRDDLESAKFNSNLIMRKCRCLEAKLQDNKDAVEKHHLQHEMGITERQTLKDYAQQLTVEKYEMKKKIEELELQQKYVTSFQNDLINREGKIKCTLLEMQTNVEKCKAEHDSLVKLIKESKISEDIVETNEFLMKENQRLKKERISMEENILILTVENQKFKSLLRLKPDINEGNLADKLIFKYWTTSVEARKDENVVTMNDKVIKDLNEVLTKEQEANRLMILQHDEDILKMQQLQTEIENNSKIKKVLEHKGDNQSPC